MGGVHPAVYPLCYVAENGNLGGWTVLSWAVRAWRGLVWVFGGIFPALIVTACDYPDLHPNQIILSAYSHAILNKIARELEHDRYIGNLKCALTQRSTPSPVTPNFEDALGLPPKTSGHISRLRRPHSFNLASLIV